MLSPVAYNIETLLQQLPRAMEMVGVPGLVLTLIAHGQPEATYAIGVTSTATQEPVTAETIFQAASLSKPLFAYGALLLHGAGALDSTAHSMPICPVPNWRPLHSCRRLRRVRC